MTDHEMEEGMNLIRYMAQKAYINFTPAMRLLYSRDDLIQEGGVVLTQLAETHVHLSKFTTMLYAALVRHYTKLVRNHLRQCRDVRIQMIPLDGLRLYYAGDHLRVDIRMQLEGIRAFVSKPARELIDFILKEADGTAGLGTDCDLTISAVSKRLRQTKYRTKLAIKELKHAIQNERGRS